MFLFIIFTFLSIFGLAFGSFINAFEYRLKNKLNFVKKRSHCPNCKHELAWYDLFPLLSFVILLGRCRYCKKKISWQYPIVEFISGVLFFLSGIFVYNILGENFVLQNFTNLSIFYGLSLFVGLILDLFLFIALYDLKYQLILNQVIIPSIVLFMILDIFLFIVSRFNSDSILFLVFFQFNLLHYLLTALTAFLFIFAIIFLTKGKGMGGGDLKLVVLLGLVLGPVKFIIAFYFAIITGSIIGIIWAIYKRKFKGLKIPFGSFLASGSIFAFLFGEKIADLAKNYLYL